MKTSKTGETKCTNFTPEKLAAIVYAFRSPYCGIAVEADNYKQHQMYFLMTTEMEITGYTYEPSIKEGQYCVAASETECEFIVQFQLNWPKSNPYYWQLETYRAYHKARRELFAIKQGQPMKNSRDHSAKIELLRNLT
ncbi:MULTISPECIES: hypothetical protein [unclassified Pseudomonas]|uniref:hypothetical protein n=1 Tax=unclassified Pseudomonas TaxID=196821 RepID=UPI000B65B2A6|nr:MULTISPECIES: hypothetical protein [unclassified Pseudomonas]HDS0929683.1 hypothetical protein [Pseudomonas putida]SNT00303.1 hypothetical protein SAMN05660216_02185 [Pseudomonas sp. LAMO17WK12:I8]SNY21842.1 hypothetical protein SAMN05660700_02188 [Pseudomonas sp. LAMO17WK12:I7]SNY23794.1 hypothetical protein SAMN05660344_02522 [Pseudomonas sp. LAMO17WK12:I11]SNY26608.1 hypothetical protein SAMN05660893_02895 [Pseudomonas sp. LAMO17WK12:I12]